MGKFRLKIEELAQDHIKQIYKSGNKGNIKKLEKIFSELSQTPYSGTGQPEQLKYNLSGYWSRRLNQKDRIVYRVDEHIVTVFVISAMGNYEDK
jgi:toxin YoeB